MVRDRSISARGLVDQLVGDLSYQAITAERDARIAVLVAECATDERELCADLAAAGHPVASVYDFINPGADFSGNYSSAYPLLVRHLQVSHHPNIREGIIRALAVPDGGPAVWEALLREFYREEGKILKWVLASALSVALPKTEHTKHPQVLELLGG
jgi:hypothetical protein